MSPIILPVSAHLRKTWARKPVGKSQSSPIRWLCWSLPEASPLISTSPRRSAAPSIRPGSTFTVKHFQNTFLWSHSTTFLDWMPTTVPRLQLCCSKSCFFFNIPTWHLTGLQDVESLSWASTGGAKKKRFFIFFFLFLEDVAEPVICTVEGPALVLTHGVIFWWMSPCVRHTGPILYFCDFSRRDTLPFALLAFLCFQFSFWTV